MQPENGYAEKPRKTLKKLFAFSLTKDERRVTTCLSPLVLCHLFPFVKKLLIFLYGFSCETENR